MYKEKIAIVSDLNEKELKTILDNFKKDIKFDIFYTNKNDTFIFFNYLKCVYKVENLDLSNYKTVLSFSTGIAHGIITNIDTNHINFQIKFDTDLYEVDKKFLKHSFRVWHAISLTRPNQNYCFTEYEKKIYSKINRASNFKKSKTLKSITIKELENQTKHSDFFYLLTKKSTYFTEEIINIFNKTGKNLFIITTPKFKSQIAEKLNPSIKISTSVSKIKNARGIIIDESFRSSFEMINLISDNYAIAYNNKIAEELFTQGYKFNQEESVETQLSKFISIAKLQQANSNLKYTVDFNSLDF